MSSAISDLRDATDDDEVAGTRDVWGVDDRGEEGEEADDPPPFLRVLPVWNAACTGERAAGVCGGGATDERPSTLASEIPLLVVQGAILTGLRANEEEGFLAE
mmetsp:Transcript_14524/g.29791  ORF Transcript_14524/g.29791 Transcript_14524/m.29791 type:complete len:103 (+) Transcript_14524:409-717(+)